MSGGRAESMKLVKNLRKQGFTVSRTGSGHWKVTHPDRGGMVIMAFSPRTAGGQDTIKHLKKLGYRP